LFFVQQFAGFIPASHQDITDCFGVSMVWLYEIPAQGREFGGAASCRIYSLPVGQTGGIS